MYESPPLVSVVVLSYNGGISLELCLKSVLETDYPRLEVLVIDNASTDGDIERIQSLYPQIRFIRNRENLGYAGGNNVGIRASNGDYVILLNQDTLVLRNWVENLIAAADSYPDGIFFQPKILQQKNPRLIDSAGNYTHILGFGYTKGMGEKDLGQYGMVCEIGHASGACVFVRKKCLNDVGLLDSLYFLYNEDTDWGWRGRLMGWKTYYVPNAVIYHDHVTKFSGEKLYFLERNRLITLGKNYTGRTIRLLVPLFLATEVALLFAFLPKGFVSCKVRAYVDLFRLLKRIIAKRKEVQERRRVSDREVMRAFTFDMGSIIFTRLSSIFGTISKAYFKLIETLI